MVTRKATVLVALISGLSFAALAGWMVGLRASDVGPTCEALGYAAITTDGTGGYSSPEDALLGWQKYSILSTWFPSPEQMESALDAAPEAASRITVESADDVTWADVVVDGQLVGQVLFIQTEEGQWDLSSVVECDA